MIGKQTRPNSNALSIPTPSDKEPVGKRSSGLAHLMSALHQNAAAVVNSKTQLNGPDQVRVEISTYFDKLRLLCKNFDLSQSKVSLHFQVVVLNQSKLTLQILLKSALKLKEFQRL